MRALLDVNVLIALFDPDHVHHSLCTDWLGENGNFGWATCPITQNGCLRIMSQPRYPNAIALPELSEALHTAVTSPHHQFIADNISILDQSEVESNRLLSPRHITDVYLLALAVANDCRFVTIDTGIPVEAAARATRDSLVVLSQ